MPGLLRRVGAFHERAVRVAAGEVLELVDVSAYTGMPWLWAGRRRGRKRRRYLVVRLAGGVQTAEVAGLLGGDGALGEGAVGVAAGEVLGLGFDFVLRWRVSTFDMCGRLLGGLLTWDLNVPSALRSGISAATWADMASCCVVLAVGENSVVGDSLLGRRMK